MSEGGNERSTGEMAMLKLESLHVIPYIRWEREGDQTSETQRAHLLDRVTRLTEYFRNDSPERLRHLLLTGQTVVLEDLAMLRPDVLSLLVVANASRRVELGPWYIEVDEALLSGESLIRNLLAARADADKHGVVLSTVAYLPAYGGHTAQLPQLLLGFNVNAAFVHHGAPLVHLPFRWEAPDGSSILVISHDERQNAALSVHDQREAKPDGPFLWMKTADQPGKLKPPGVSLPILQSSLATYVKTLRHSMKDELRPSLQGELRLQGMRERGYLLPGTLSARLYLKQANARLQNVLTYTLEPLLTIAMTHGKFESPENARALLTHSWRLLLKNQSRATLGGYAADVVHEENEVRFRQVEDTAQYVLNQALHALSGHGAKTDATTCVVVWNTHNWSIEQFVQLTLDLPPDTHPAQVISPDGAEQTFSWAADERRLSFLAEAPAVGYAAYTVMLSSTPPAEAFTVQRSTANSIANSAGATLSADTGELVWRYGNAEIRDLLRFIDSGDAGDTFNYSPPRDDVIEQAMLVSGIQSETSTLYERLILRHRMRVAPALRPDRTRDRGVRLLEFQTTATFYDGMPGVYFKTEFVNTAEDHRLRVHLRSGISSESILADAAFGVIERQIRPEGVVYPTQPKWEGIADTYPMLGVCAVQDESAAMALVARGLPEFEALPEDGQTTLALTLVRAVGWISRDDLLTRTASIGAVRAAPGAQCLHPLSAEYGLIPLSANDPAGLLRLSKGYNAPLQAYQYDTKPERSRRSYLSIQTSLGTGGESDGNGAILTALKPPQNGRGWIVRLFNPTYERVEVHLTSATKPRFARVTALSEDPQTIIEPDANGTLNFVLQPQQIMTLRLGFG